MRTPAGNECPYFYGDYYRGRSQEECRLLKDSGQQWSADLCKTCPVPEIARANACEYQILEAQVRRSFFALKKRVEIKARCTKCVCRVEDPHIGCGQCHSDLQFLIGE